MSDIFLSCAAADNLKAEKFAGAFEAQGWTPFLDLAVGVARPSTERRQELEGAKVFVVLWSRGASGSPWVSEALQRASERACLIVVLLERVKVPHRFTPNEILDFSDWDGTGRSEAWRDGVPVLLECVRAFAGKPARRAAPSAPAPGAPRPEVGDEPPPHEGHAPPPPEDGKRFEGVFISYRRSEAAAYAGRLYDRLAARFGRGKVFLDVENIAWGEDFVEAITAAAGSCAVMMVLISRAWVRGEGGQQGNDDYVRLEVATALGRKIPVIPILIQGASMPAPRELPEDLLPLVRRNALALSDTRWERDVEDLLKALEGFLKD